MSKMIRGLIRQSPHSVCSKCHREFEDFEDTSGNKERVCPECSPMRGTTHTKDAWSYTRSGVGYRLIAGFNLMNACERGK